MGGLDLSTALGDAGSNAVVLDVVLVVCLDLSTNAVERALQRILGRGVHHLGLFEEWSV